MKNLLIFLILASGFTTNCTFANEPSPIDEILATLDTAGESWLDFWGYDQLTKRDLKQVGTEPIKFNNALWDSNVSELFKIYSDSSHTVYADIYSGSYYLDSSINKIKLISEPESILKLFYKGRLTELLHYGYTIVFQDVFWITKNKFIVVGYEIGENDEDSPMVWYFDIGKKEYSFCTLNAKRRINGNTYLLDKLKKIKR